jgi:hypothetical protein
MMEVPAAPGRQEVHGGAQDERRRQAEAAAVPRPVLQVVQGDGALEAALGDREVWVRVSSLTLLPPLHAAATSNNRAHAPPASRRPLQKNSPGS